MTFVPKASLYAGKQLGLFKAFILAIMVVRVSHLQSTLGEHTILKAEQSAGQYVLNVQNVAAQLLGGFASQTHTVPKDLHWLPILFWSKFNIFTEDI